MSACRAIPRTGRISLTIACIATLALTTTVPAQSAADTAAIRAAALDYIEGWYAGNAGRMERAVHPDLAKRIMNTNSAPRAGTRAR